MAERKNLYTIGYLCILDDAVGTNLYIAANHDSSLKDDIHIDFHILSANEFAAQIKSIGVNNRHTGFKKSLSLHSLPHPFKPSKL